jgi:quercetin dioxygenase-like cupin family protein
MTTAPGRPFTILREADVIEELTNLYGGDGTISARYFRFDQSPAPANFVIFDIPPGASEGVHAHPLSGPNAYDEYYYVIDGEGEMTIGSDRVAIRTGDHVHSPLGVAHGVRNSGQDKSLRIFLTYILR